MNADKFSKFNGCCYLLAFETKKEDIDTDGTLLDTKVRLNGMYLCTISGTEIDAFCQEFEKTIKRYKI